MNLSPVESFFLWYNSADYQQQYSQRRKALKALFENYSTATDEQSAIMNHILGAHAAHCKQFSCPELSRKHNAFVLRYIAGYSIREVADQSNTTVRQLFRDIAEVFSTMMVLLYGVDGLPPRKRAKPIYASGGGGVGDATAEPARCPTVQ